jgi:hypothetical protein
MTTKERYSEKKVSLITVVVNSDLSPLLIDALKEIGLLHINTTPGRGIVLREEKGIRSLFEKKQSLIEKQIVIISFLMASGK